MSCGLSETNSGLVVAVASGVLVCFRVWSYRDTRSVCDHCRKQQTSLAPVFALLLGVIVAFPLFYLAYRLTSLTDAVRERRRKLTESGALDKGYTDDDILLLSDEHGSWIMCLRGRKQALLHSLSSDDRVEIKPRVLEGLFEPDGECVSQFFIVKWDGREIRFARPDWHSCALIKAWMLSLQLRRSTAVADELRQSARLKIKLGIALSVAGIAISVGTSLVASTWGFMVAFYGLIAAGAPLVWLGTTGLSSLRAAERYLSTKPIAESAYEQDGQKHGSTPDGSS